MAQEFKTETASPIPAPPASSELDEIFELLASSLYSLASMLVGEGEESAQLVETAIGNAEVSVCCDPAEARKSSQRALAAEALGLIEQRTPGALSVPEGISPAGVCIEDDDLEAAGLSHEELERMIAGPDRERVRNWLASLPNPLRTIFVLRAVARFSATETSALLAAVSSNKTTEWTPEAVRLLFRQGLCSLASQLIHATSATRN